MDLHVRAGPAAGSGDTVVFLHGFPFDGSLWDDQLTALPDGWHGLAPDLRGFGRTPLGAGELPRGSDAPDAVARADEAVLPMDVLAADVARLIQERAGRAVICGLSMGGYVVFALRRQRPDLVRALILMDTRAAADSPEARQNRRRMAGTARSAGAEPIATTMIPSLLAPDTRQDRPDVVDRVREMIRATSPRTLIAAAAGMAARADSTPDLPEIDVPTLVVVGAEDTITPPDEARSMAAAIPNARVEVVEGAGHLASLERPAAANTLIASFLAGL